MRRWVGAGVVLALAIVPAAVGGPERATATPQQPNILFVLTDDQSYEALQYGLPALDAEPGGHWVRFEQAFVNTAQCCPSRATMLSGQYGHNHGVIVNSLGARFDDTSTIATWLDDAGYRTGLIGKYLNTYPFPERGPVVPPGWDSWYAFSGKVAYRDFDTIDGGGVVEKHPKKYSTDVVTNQALRFVEQDSTEPFFLYLAYNAPHAPGTPAKRHVGTYRKLKIKQPPNFNEADVSDKPQWIRDRQPLSTKKIRKSKKNRREQYEALLAVDEGIERITSELEDQGKLDDTVIVFMTDNGYAFGEHRYFAKSCSYEECIRTDLLVRYPDGPSETRVVDDLVSNVDIAPTFAELGGATPASPVDGTSFVPILEGESPAARAGVLLEWRATTSGSKSPKFWAVRTATHKWVEYDHGERELYDLVADPYELENLAGTQPALEAELHDLLVELRDS